MADSPEDPEIAGDEVEGELRSTSPVFDARVLEERLDILPERTPLVFARADSVRDAMRAMQKERRGCVLITEDGTALTPMIGIFTERDILYRIVDRGQNPAVLSLGDVMTHAPESVPRAASIAWVLNQMAVGGFRHIPVVDESGCPVFVVSVRDIVNLLVEFFQQQVLNLPPQYDGNRAKKREGA